MTVCCDTHVHVWPGHDPAATLARLAGALSRLAPDADRVAVVVDGRGCDGFGRLAALSGGRAGSFVVRPGPDPLALSVYGPGDAPELWVVAGRQIVTAERLEILALGTRAAIPDGEPADRTLEAALKAGALPVLAWAPGKWLGRRGKLVGGLIEQFRGRPILLGDTSLRARGWPTPRLIRRGVAAGLGCVCGSDPLPAGGEERHAGRFATRVEGRLDAQRPVSSLLDALRTGGKTSVGRRSSPVEMLARLLRHRLASHQ